MRDIVVSGEQPWIEVSMANYPVLFKCLGVLSGDAGYGIDHSTYSISHRWQEALPMVEAAISALDDTELSVLLLGDLSGQERISARSMPLNFAHNLFNDFAES